MKVVERAVPGVLDDAFVHLPSAVYADDPCWVPEDEAGLRAAFDSTNPWFTRGRAMTMCVPGRARLAVFHTPALAVDGRRAAFFGYFESDGDVPAVTALLARARDWARARGAEVLYGPVDFDTFGRYRLRASAEPGALPFLGEPYNAAIYPALLHAAGFPVVRRYVSQVSAGPVVAGNRERAALAALDAAGLSIEPLDGARWLAMLPEIHAAADAIFGDAFAYAPIPYEEFLMRYGAGVARRMCPHTSLLVRAAGGEVAAFLLCYPQYGPLLVQGAASGPVPVSSLSYEEHAPRLAAMGARGAVAKTVGVVPAYRNQGMLSAIGAAAIARGAGRYDAWIAALIRDDNPSRRFGDRRARLEREYVLHGRSLASEPHGAPAA